MGSGVVDPATPHPQDGSFQIISLHLLETQPASCWDVLNPRARKHWNAPPEKFENPLKYYGLLCRNDVCTIIWLLQLVKQVESSSLAPAHPFQSSGYTWIHSLAGESLGSVSSRLVALFPHQTAWE